MRAICPTGGASYLMFLRVKSLEELYTSPKHGFVENKVPKYYYSFNNHKYYSKGYHEQYRTPRNALRRYRVKDDRGQSETFRLKRATPRIVASTPPYPHPKA